MYIFKIIAQIYAAMAIAGNPCHLFLMRVGGTSCLMVVLNAFSELYLGPFMSEHMACIIQDQVMLSQRLFASKKRIPSTHGAQKLVSDFRTEDHEIAGQSLPNHRFKRFELRACCQEQHHEAPI